MATIHLRAHDRDGLARFLGWFSIGLGTMQVAAPAAVCKLIGASGEGRSKTVMRLMGARELGHGTAILTSARPTAGVASRIAGDALDVAMLGLVAAQNPGRRARTAFGLVNVLPIVVADVMETKHLARKRGPKHSGKQVVKSVTINRPRDEVEAAWVAAEETRHKVDAAHANVRFDEAPGNRGTELVVSWVQDPPAGDFGVIATKLTGSDLATQLADDLKRLKQVVETGEVVRSDSTPEGHLRSNHMKQRPAQPLKEAVR